MKKLLIFFLVLSLLALLDHLNPTGFAQDSNFNQALGKLSLKIRDNIAPSVVAIIVDRKSDPDGQGPRGQFVEYRSRPKGPCSGTIIEKDGYILTSYFNVSGEIKSISVVTHDQKTYPAKLLGYDKKNDIALLKIDANELTALETAVESEIKQGNFVFVVGRSPDPEYPTINYGIISSTYRMAGTHAQTDAELNYANVGGPLVDSKGRLIGITCHIKAKSHWGQSGGVGFAMKIGAINKILADLKNGKIIEHEKTPYLGIMAQEGEEDAEGIEVAQVMPGSPAEQAGLRQGDIIIEVDGKKMKEIEPLVELIQSRKVGDKITIKIKRKVGENYQEQTLTATLQEDPS